MGSVVTVKGVDVKGAVGYSGVGENVVVGAGWKEDLEGAEVGVCAISTGVGAFGGSSWC